MGSHTRKRKQPLLRTMFDKVKTHEVSGALGKYEIDEFRDFYIVKKKLQHPSQKGFYDPTAFVVAKKDPKMPFFPDPQFARVFGTSSPFFPLNIGVKGNKDRFLKHMRKAVKDNEISLSEVVSPPTYTREVFKPLTSLVPSKIDFGDSKLSTWLERKLYGRKITIKKNK